MVIEVEVNEWMLGAADGLKEDSVRKVFNRARIWLQDHDYTREYDGKAWFIDEPDGQDK
jgi:hypothetical protein